MASIFVNPMQFGPNEDFAHYPRTPREDERMLAGAGCDLMFMPDVQEIYPHGAERATRVEVPGPVAHPRRRVPSRALRRASSTVVAKLFHIVEPDVAVFGEKDFQQLTVIRRMVADLCMPVEIVGAPTVRDADGLAMSSRNQYLTDAERALAPRSTGPWPPRARLRPAMPISPASSAPASSHWRAAGFRPDYFSVRRADDLSSPGARRRANWWCWPRRA